MKKDKKQDWNFAVAVGIGTLFVSVLMWSLGLIGIHSFSKTYGPMQDLEQVYFKLKLKSKAALQNRDSTIAQLISKKTNIEKEIKKAKAATDKKHKEDLAEIELWYQGELKRITTIYAGDLEAQRKAMLAIHTEHVTRIVKQTNDFAWHLKHYHTPVRRTKDMYRLQFNHPVRDVR